MSSAPPGGGMSATYPDGAVCVGYGIRDRDGLVAFHRPATKLRARCSSITNGVHPDLDAERMHGRRPAARLDHDPRSAHLPLDRCGGRPDDVQQHNSLLAALGAGGTGGVNCGRCAARTCRRGRRTWRASEPSHSMFRCRTRERPQRRQRQRGQEDPGRPSRCFCESRAGRPSGVAWDSPPHIALFAQTAWTAARSSASHSAT